MVAGAKTVTLSQILLFSLLKSKYMYIPQNFLRHFSLRGTLGVWDSGRIGEGGVRQMGEERVGEGGSKRVGSRRNCGLKGKME